MILGQLSLFEVVTMKFCSNNYFLIIIYEMLRLNYLLITSLMQSLGSWSLSIQI